MRHPAEGVLRRLVDEPAGVADTDRRHVAGCPLCLAALGRTRADAQATSAALRPVEAQAVDVDAAWSRLAASAAGEQRRVRPATAASRGRWRTALRSPVAAAMGAVVVLSGAGAAAATDWLPIFRTQHVVPVPVTTTDLVRVPDLSAYGDLQVTGDRVQRPVPDAAAAKERTGLILPRVGPLPRGVTGNPSYQTGDRVTATFTFRADKAAQAAAAAGAILPPAPAGLDGSRLRVTAGPAAAQVWAGVGGVPNLVVGRFVAPTVESSGLPYATVRDYLLSLPGLPEDVAAQLRSVSADGTTLPLLVPVDKATSSTAQVQGRPATVLAARDGSVAAVVWVDDGIVTGVAGAVSAEEVLGVARALR